MDIDFTNSKDFFTIDNINYFNNCHREIIDKLLYFVKNNQIPNIIFYGSNSCGKKYILKYFLQEIYKKSTNIQDNILCINCCHGKGNIKFIREELKLFSNSIIINNNSQTNIKSVILLNADSLTIDAQSSLRRLIEVNNKTTRFFIVVNNYERLLRPIISRFCSIYFNLPIINGKYITYNNILHKNNSNNNQIVLKRLINKYREKIDINNLQSNSDVINISVILYNKGFSGLDIIKYIENSKVTENKDCIDKYKLLNIFEYLVKEFRNEKIIIYHLLNYIFFRYNYNIKKFL